MTRCHHWLCPFPPVGRLEFFNCNLNFPGPNAGNVCAGHLAEHKREHLLEAERG